MPRTSAVNMKCPRSEHAGSRVKLDGTYGKPGHRRQRYTCLPGGGGKPHVFTELLPREESWHSSCEHCERQLERREGPKAPRHYRFVVAGIAEALQAVGTGSTYMRASRVTRDRARRLGSFASLELPLAVFARAVPGLLPRQKLGEHVRLSAPSWQARIALSSVAGFSVSTVSFTREPACSDLGHFIFAALVLGIRRVSHIGRTD